MIVVAAHNNIDLLENILNNLLEINLNNHKVLIIDTNSDDNNFINFFEECKQTYSDFIFEKKNYTCWDSGAFIHAYKTYTNENRFIFLQDSLKIINKDLIVLWDNLLDSYDVVPWMNFGYWFKTDEHREWAENGLPNTDKPQDAIFGPIFGVNKKVLDDIPKDWFKEPSTKLQGCAMEGRWSYMFHLIKAKKHYIEYFNDGMGVHVSKNNIFKYFFHRE